MQLEPLGWSSVRQESFRPHALEGLAPARVTCEHRGMYAVITESGERMAEVSGRFRHHAAGRADFPAVGDWVAVELPDAVSNGLIHIVLPRLSAFVRKAPGEPGAEQVVAANIDTAFLVSGLDYDFNPRRIERYLTLAHESGAQPVVVLNKADLVADPDRARQQAQALARDIPVLAVSATHATGLAPLWEYLTPGTTGALLGSSGVGKSSLINALTGNNALKTSAVREHDSHGRHTTTYRELLVLPNGAALIDTPGMRELQLLADDAALGRSFDEIAELADRCRFRDCTHTAEPGCAVLAALEAGGLSEERYASYLKQRKEIRFHQSEQDVRLRIAEKNRWKAIMKSVRDHPKGRYQP